MAQQDTGLGWSADQDYLKYNAGIVATLQGIGGFPAVPVAQTASDLVATPIVYTYHSTSGTGWEYAYKIGADVPGCVYALIQNGSQRQLWVMSTDNTAHFYYIRGERRQGSTADYTWGSVIDQDIRYISDQLPTGIYYGSTLATVPSGYETEYTFITPAEAGAQIAIIQEDILKSEDGACVCCIVSWINSGGNVMKSPILISSSREFATMETDMSGLYFATDTRLIDGMNFHMQFIQNVDAGIGIVSVSPAVDLTEIGPMDIDTMFGTVVRQHYANIIVTNPPDPYADQTGESGEDGGDGEDIVDDDVDFTPLPSSMAVASGFITLFCPSQYELNQLANYMWSPLFDVDTFKKLFANPMDCIMGLAVYPFPISASGTKTVSVGGIATTVSMGYTLQQYHIVDCGSVYVPKQWGAYMDYAPYTRFNIFLPYIGFRSVSADDIMGKTISLRYMVDILSGACNAELKCGSTVLYSWAGSCAAQIPITGNDWRSAITSGISIAGSVAATVLTQGASAPMIAGTVASATVNSMQLKPEVQRSGSISGSSGFLAGQRPYLVRTNPRIAIPANQNKYSGYPSFVTILLGSLTGYNEVYSVHLENIPATGAELDEIESILKGGAIF